MGNLLTPLGPEEIEPIRSKTGFSENQIRRLYSRFNHLDKSNKGFLTRDDMKLIPELAVNPLGNRIIEAFFIDDEDPTVSLEQINFQQFVCVLAKFRKLKSQKVEETSYNTLEQKIEFVFRIYDVDRDGYISKDDLGQVLRAMVGLHVSDEQLKSIVRRTLNEADMDNDRQISREEFKKALADVDISAKMTINFLHT